MACTFSVVKPHSAFLRDTCVYRPRDVESKKNEAVLLQMLMEDVSQTFVKEEPIFFYAINV